MKKQTNKKREANIYQIDQSGKIEYTSHDTAIAFSNGKKKAIFIKAKDKRLLQKRFREAGKGQVFTLRLFALLIFSLLKKEDFSDIIVDIEYPGRSDLIKNYLIHDFARIGKRIDPSHIHFQLIGKKSEAHWHAYYVFRKKRKPELTTTAKEVLKEIFH